MPTLLGSCLSEASPGWNRPLLGHVNNVSHRYSAPDAPSLSGFEAFDGFEQALAVDDSEDLDRLVAQLVNHTVAVDEALAHVGIVQLGYDASELGIQGQVIAEIVDVLNDLLGVEDGVALDVFGD